MPGALTHDPIRVGGGLHQNADGSVATDADGRPNALSVLQIASVLASAPQRYSIGIAVFGDSHSSNAVYTDGTSPDGLTVPAWFVDGATNNNWRAWGWPAWVGPLSMQRARVVKSWARQTNGLLFAGTTPVGVPLSVQVTQAMADPLWAQVDRAAICIGFNDMAFTIAECVAELLKQIRRLGKPVDLITSPPRSDAPNTATQGDGMQGWAWMATWRNALRYIADASGGWVRWIDGYGAIVTPTTTPPVYAASRSSDTIHPNSGGAYLIADAYVQSLFPSGIGGDLDIWPTASYASTSGANSVIDQGFANPTFATASGGTGTGTIAGSLTVTNSGATHSGSVGACTIPGGVGNMQTLAITASAAGDYVNVAGATVHAAGGTFLAAGDKCFAQCLLRVNSGGIYPRNMRLINIGTQGGTNYFSTLFEIDATKEVALPLTATRTLLLRTPVITMPSGAAFSSLPPALRLTFAAAGSCTVDISNFEVRRIRSGGVYA